MTVIFPLYLAQRHDSSTTIGIVLTVGSLIGAGMVAAVGLLGDRFGRRPLLIGVGILGALGALALAGATGIVVVTVASGFGGIGRGGGAGSGGSFGPFFPAEQPLLAASVPASRRTRAFGRMGFIGVLAAAAGSLVAGVPTSLHHAGLSWDDAYRLVFLIGAVLSVIVVAVSWPLREHKPQQSSEAPADRSAPTSADQPSANRSSPAGLSTKQLVGRLGLTNALNGFGFGFLGPLLTYWFYVRFGAGPAEVGVLYAVVNLVSAIPYLGAHRLTARLGAVRTVVVTRAASVVMLLAMAFVPTFVLAGLFLSLRTIVNSLGLPARQSYAMGAAVERRRGTVAALGTLPSMLSSSVSPAVGGALLGVFVDVPIVGASFFMAANVVAYYLAFRHSPLPGERASAGSRWGRRPAGTQAPAATRGTAGSAGGSSRSEVSAGD